MRDQRAKVRLARLAERQFGRVSWSQLQEIGVRRGQFSRWLADGYLYRELPHVYAVGHRARTVEGDLAAALLYAGPGAALSHATAAWWLGLLERRPTRIHVTTPRRCGSVRGIRVHDRSKRPRISHKGLPSTTVPQILLDLAATQPLNTLRKALANAEYHRLLNLQETQGLLKRGSRGAARLRQAIEVHQPRLALTKSDLEDLLVTLCEEEGIPLPQINVKVDGWEVDAYWPDAKLAVELDGYSNHHTPAQLKRDRRKEMALRGKGLTAVRYSGEQLRHHRREVAAELRSATAP